MKNTRPKRGLEPFNTDAGSVVVFYDSTDEEVRGANATLMLTSSSFFSNRGPNKRSNFGPLHHPRKNKWHRECRNVFNNIGNSFFSAIDVACRSQYQFFSNTYAFAWISTFLLIIIFIQEIILNGSLINRSTMFFFNTNISAEVLLRMGALNTNMIRQRDEFLRIFWSMWLHKGTSHVALNILCQLPILSFLGTNWGFLRLVFVYFVSGISGSLLSATYNPCSTTVGCSGALFGIMGSTLTYCLENWRTMIKPKLLLAMHFVVFIMAFLWGYQTTVDSWSHLGGYIAGIISSLITFRCVFYASTEFPGPPSVLSEARYPHHMNCLKNLYKSFKDYMRNANEASNFSHSPTAWLVRIVATTSLIVAWIFLFQMISLEYPYNPIGQISFKGIRSCCCCTIGGTSKIKFNYRCEYCDVNTMEGFTWGDYCALQRKTSPI